jgi:hypothetical protein
MLSILRRHWLVAAAAALIAPTGALGLTSSYSTGDSLFYQPGNNGPISLNQGWWSNDLANRDSNDNYYVGHSTFTGADHRDFFTFDLSGLPAGEVVAATLQLRRYASNSGNEAIETLELFDVSTDAATLNKNDSINPAIFADLGSGTSYGSFDLPGAADDRVVLELALNVAALADIASAAGGFFSIGGVLISDDGDDAVFVASGGSPQQLIIEVVPEPGTGVLLAIGLLGLVRARRARAGQTSPRPTYT